MTNRPCPYCNAPSDQIAENCAPNERAVALRDGWLTYLCEACGEQWEPHTRPTQDPDQ